MYYVAFGVVAIGLVIYSGYSPVLLSVVLLHEKTQYSSFISCKTQGILKFDVNHWNINYMFLIKL